MTRYKKPNKPVPDLYLTVTLRNMVGIVDEGCSKSRGLFSVQSKQGFPLASESWSFLITHPGKMDRNKYKFTKHLIILT